MTSGISKTGRQLALWLQWSGYNRNDFKYDKSLKSTLDDLKEKYYNGTLPPEDYVTLIRDYCIQYNEWPKQRDTKEVHLDSGISKTSNQLTMWLNNTSGYSKGNFKYDKTLKNILDDLKEKYYEKVATPEDYVKLIRDYCIQYNEWPKYDGTKEIQLDSGISKTSNQLAVWLQKSGYSKGNFKYDEELRNILDDLQKQYYRAKNNYDNIDQITSADSHFQKVVHSIENSMEDKSGRKLH